METETKTRISRVCRVGNIPGEGNLYFKATIEDGKLSISGVIGPLANGDCRGSCGQIDGGFKHRSQEQDDKRYTDLTPADSIEYAPNWDAEKWLDLLDIWKEYHLNDLTPGCEHQRRDWNPSKELEIVEYRLTTEACSEKHSIKTRSTERLEAHGQARINEDEQRLICLAWSIKRPAEAQLDEYMTGVYKEHSRETKTAGWLSQDEHPEGILEKPCPECGYKYGTKWLKVELPQRVIDFIEALPEADRAPAWV